MLGGVPGFFTPRLVPAALAAPGTPEALSFYDSAPLRETLDSLIDWDLLNAGPVRLSVGAVDIESGNFRYFDTTEERLDARHIMASARSRRACRDRDRRALVLGRRAGLEHPAQPRARSPGGRDGSSRSISSPPPTRSRARCSTSSRARRKSLLEPHAPGLRRADAAAQGPRAHPPRPRQAPARTCRGSRRAGAAAARRRAAGQPRPDDLPRQRLEGGSRDFEFSARSMREHWQAGRTAVAETMANARLVARTSSTARLPPSI